MRAVRGGAGVRVSSRNERIEQVIYHGNVSRAIILTIDGQNSSAIWAEMGSVPFCSLTFFFFLLILLHHCKVMHKSNCLINAY
jgi:hypothetical protein